MDQFCYKRNTRIVLCAGVGSSALMLCPPVIVQHYFDKKRAFATGIALMGCSVSVFSIPPLYGYLIEEHGWRVTLRVHVAFLLQGLILAALFRPLDGWTGRTRDLGMSGGEPEVNSSSRTTFVKSLYLAMEDCKHLFDITVFKNTAFTVYVIGNFFLPYGIHVVYVESVSRAVSKGIPLLQASFLGTAIGVGAASGRIFSSIVGNLKCTNRTLLYGTAALTGGMTSLLIGLSQQYLVWVLLSVTYGFTAGMYRIVKLSLKLNSVWWLGLLVHTHTHTHTNAVI